MAKTKTAETKVNVEEFINSFATTEEKRQDSFELVKIMQEITGHKPKMWGPSIIGFGSYHYKYESGHEGDSPLMGFSPRKAEFSLYAYTGLREHEYLLDNLGKIKVGKACIYFKKLSDLDQKELKKLIKETIKYMKANYEVK
ncbi:MAG: DUF1801 domain-containing protein [Cyclobacteriaceae bacterium]|nr:DUF1801 domain-containing protein [Cyclobacteriaceae bacterium]